MCVFCFVFCFVLFLFRFFFFIHLFIWIFSSSRSLFQQEKTMTKNGPTLTTTNFYIYEHKREKQLKNVCFLLFSLPSFLSLLLPLFSDLPSFLFPSSPPSLLLSFSLQLCWFCFHQQPQLLLFIQRCYIVLLKKDLGPLL